MASYTALEIMAIQKAYESMLDDILAGISDLSVPWSRTEDLKTCEYCDFRNICGR